MKTSRRQFLTSSSATVLGVGLTAFGTKAKAENSGLNEGYEVVAEYQDTWTNWVGSNHDTLIIRAEDFIIGSVTGLIADERGSHHHTFDVSPEDMEKLKRGEVVQIRTSVTYEHSHLITIDPVKFKIPGGTMIQVKKKTAQEPS